jgi:hypothetical protein
LAADLLAWRGGAESFVPQNGDRRRRQKADTGLAFLVPIWFALLVFLFGLKILALFGLVVAVAMFLFPCGLGGLVVLGVALLFLLVPNHRVDGC